MSLYIKPLYDRKKELQNKVAQYNPSDEIKERDKQVRSDFSRAQAIRDDSYTEFNDTDLITFHNRNQLKFNSYVPKQDEDPDNSWRANVVKPITRNKCISIAAHVTAAVLYPNVQAQNANSENDRDAAIVMKDLVEYSWIQSKYERFMVNSVVSAMYSPAVIVHEDFAEVQREVKRDMVKGKYSKENILDKFFSGFQNNLVPVDQFYVGNIYEPELQKQPFIVRRRVIDYSEAQLRYQKTPNWEYVRPGVRYFFNDENGLYYEDDDDKLSDDQVEEVIYYNRLSDLEIVYVNGINVYNDPERPIQRFDKNYPYIHFGFEKFNERFFYYKPLVDKLAPEQNIIDVLYSMAIDAAMLQTMPPALLFGDESVDSSISVPGKVTPFNKDTKVETLQTGTNMTPALNMLKQMEDSLSESSASSLLGGSTPRGANTAFEVATMQQNAMKVLGLFGKMVKFFVEDFGNMRINTILQFMTVAEAVEGMGDFSKLRFREILIPDRMEGGKKTNKKVRFTLDTPETEEDAGKRSFELLKEEKEKDMTIAEVNPTLFRSLQYSTKVEADMLFSQSEAVKKALNLEAYDRAINNPVIQQDPESMREVTREFLLGNYVPGEEDKYLPQGTVNMLTQMAGGQAHNTGLTENIMRQAGVRQPVV